MDRAKAGREFRRLFGEVRAELGSWTENDASLAKVLSSLGNVARRAESLVASGALTASSGTGDRRNHVLGVLAGFEGAAERLTAKHITELERLLQYLRRILGAYAESLAAVEKSQEGMLALQQKAHGPMIETAGRDASFERMLEWTMDVSRMMQGELHRRRHFLRWILDADGSALNVNTSAVGAAVEHMGPRTPRSHWDEALAVQVLEALR